jgi:CRP-like cAMP-binding protein
MTQAQEALRGLPLFSHLDEAALEAVARRTVIRQVPRDGVIFRRGDPCAGLYVVLEGRVRVYRASADGREQVIHAVGPGRALADGGPYPASARATEEARILFLPRDDFQWLYRHHPEIADVVIRDLGRRLRRMVALVEKISLRDVPARVALSLMEYAESEGQLRDGGELKLPRTQEEMASELATTRESVARALARLRREGAIRQRGRRVAIVSLARLESAAGR